MLSLTAYIV